MRACGRVTPLSVLKLEMTNSWRSPFSVLLSGAVCARSVCGTNKSRTKNTRAVFFMSGGFLQAKYEANRKLTAKQVQKILEETPHGPEEFAVLSRRSRRLKCPAMLYSFPKWPRRNSI